MEYRHLFIDRLSDKHQAPILGVIDEWIEQYKKKTSWVLNLKKPCSFEQGFFEVFVFIEA